MTKLPKQGVEMEIHLDPQQIGATVQVALAQSLRATADKLDPKQPAIAINAGLASFLDKMGKLRAEYAACDSADVMLAQVFGAFDALREGR